MRVGVIGAGPVGMALVTALKRGGETELRWYVRNEAIRTKLREEGLRVSFQAPGSEFDLRAFVPGDPDNISTEGLEPAVRPATSLKMLEETEPDLDLSFTDEELISKAELFIETQPDVSFSCTKADSLFTVRSQIASRLKGLCFFVVNGFWLHPGLDLGVMFGGGFSQGTRLSLIPRGRLMLGRVKSPHADFLTVEPEAGAGTLIYRLEEIEMLESLANQVDDNVLRVEVQPDIYMTMLRKAALNCLVNPLAALSGHPNGALLMDEVRPIAGKLAREIVDVLVAASFVQKGDESISVKSLISDFERICCDTAGNFSSQLIDRIKGRRSETKHLNRLLLGIAQRYGIPMPVNATICALLRLPMEDSAAI
ncbi:ketopantoate reductase family protein [bacterium]|nr:ketopantoate reductase family protein [bacterium]